MRQALRVSRETLFFNFKNFNSMINITASTQQAIGLAKWSLRRKNNVKRLPYIIHRNTTAACNCGETKAIEIVTKVKNSWSAMTVSVCSFCSNFSDLTNV